MFGGASIDAHGTALTDETLDGVPATPTRCCSPPSVARNGTPPTPTSPAPSRACSACARASACSRTSGRSSRSPPLYDASPLKRELIDGTDLMVVRELTGGIYFGEKTRTADSRLGRLRVHARGDRADRPRRVQRRAISGHERRQGQRARDQPALARGRARDPRERVPEHRARAPARRQRRDEADRRAPPLRRDPDREHVRRHPQRRGGDAHGVDRHAPERFARERTARAVRARPRLRARHRRHRRRQPARDVPVGGDDAAPRTRLWRPRRRR